ncbi:MAG TPA: nuclear transport factor 2 family protein [Burkholderiales bacterium]|nr:nuclear transport factor 2 family protein [Burkholderiales bacterium]
MSDVARIVEYFESLTPDTVARLSEHYAANAWFKDPFNEVTGLEAIRRVFAHMYRQVEEPRFRVTDRVVADNGALLVWDFTFRLGLRAIVVRGATHLRFNGRGKVTYHRDYWDTAEELYGKLPLLGTLTRLLRRRLAAS